MKDYEDYNHSFDDDVNKDLYEKPNFEEYELDSQEIYLNKQEKDTIDYYNMGKVEPTIPSWNQGPPKEEAIKEVVENLISSPEPTKTNYFDETVKPKKKKIFPKIAVWLLVICLAGGSGALIGVGLLDRYRTEEKIASSIENEADSVTDEEKFRFAESESEDIAVFSNVNSSTSLDVPSMLKTVTPAVVNITCTIETIQSTWGGYSMPYQYDAAGSGIIFHEDNEKVYIVTNNHVIEDANALVVTIEDTHQVPATIVGSDSQSDLGVIYVTKADMKSAGVESITMATFGDSDRLELGEQVIAIGNALGEGQSITGGMVSALGRQVPIDGKVLELIQTDAAINSGNSGGALVNQNGEVIGVNTAKISDSMNSLNNKSVEGMGYAIPSNTLKPIIEEIMNSGYVQRPQLGIYPSNITEEISSAYGNRLPVGVFINEVMEGSGAAKAGLQKYDVIIEFNGKTILDTDALNEAIAELKVGDIVTLGVVRDSSFQEIDVILQDANN